MPHDHITIFIWYAHAIARWILKSTLKGDIYQIKSIKIDLCVFKLRRMPRRGMTKITHKPYTTLCESKPTSRIQSNMNECAHKQSRRIYTHTHTQLWVWQHWKCRNKQLTFRKCIRRHETNNENESSSLFTRFTFVLYRRAHSQFIGCTVSIPYSQRWNCVEMTYNYVDCWCLLLNQQWTQC